MVSSGYDVIIIGAGIGGLSAGAMLANEGLKVLVLEKNDHPGGTAYAYVRKGFRFPMGPLGFSAPGLVRRMLKDLGRSEGLALLYVDYMVQAFGLHVPLSLPFDPLQKRMGGIFPADALGIEQFFRYVQDIVAAIHSPEQDGSRILLQEAALTSARDYIHGLIRDWRLRRILGSIGTHEAYSGIPLLAAMWGLMCQEGIWYPEGGMRSFCEGLAGILTNDSPDEKGPGEIRLGTQVTGIRVEHGRAAGITLADGTTIDAPAVISNADFKTTFLRLLEPGSMPGEWLDAVGRTRQSGSILQVCLGVDKSAADLSLFSEAGRIIYRRNDFCGASSDKGPDWSAPELEGADLACQELEVSLWSKEDGDLAPEGGAVIVIRAEADYGHFARYRPAWGKRAPGYRAYKTRLGMALVKEAARFIPGLEQAIRIMDVATPLTFEERGGRSEGAVAGWSWDFEDNPGYRPIEMVLTPIQCLYMAGYQAYSALFMGGIPMAMASGVRSAEALLNAEGPDMKFWHE